MKRYYCRECMKELYPTKKVDCICGGKESCTCVLCYECYIEEYKEEGL